MDLITRIAACAVTVDPKVMHALIWHQSGGELWSLSLLGERQRYTYRSAREAVVQAHRSTPTGFPIRVGLTGSAVGSGAPHRGDADAAPDVSIVARQIMQLSDRCNAVPRIMGNSIHCAVAAYYGSSDHPDNKFADVVLTSVAKGDAPNFDMPDEIGARLNDIATDARLVGQRISRARAPLRLTINSRAGRARCFPQGTSSSKGPLQAVRTQIDRETRAR
jgi:hypothetical protein